MARGAGVGGSSGCEGAVAGAFFFARTTRFVLAAPDAEPLPGTSDAGLGFAAEVVGLGTGAAA